MNTQIYKEKCNAYGSTHHDGPEYVHLNIVRESVSKPEKVKTGMTDSLKKIALKSTESLRAKLNVTKAYNIVKNNVSIKKIHDTMTAVIQGKVKTVKPSRNINVINTESINNSTKIENIFLNFVDSCYKQGSSLVNKTVQFIVDGTVYTIN